MVEKIVIIMWVGLVLGLAGAGETYGQNDIDLTRGVYVGRGKNLLSQDEFNSLSSDIGLVTSPLALDPPGPSRGIEGFEIGAAFSVADIFERSNYWDKVTKDGKAPDFYFIPRIEARKGLPAAFDLGLGYAYVDGTNIKVLSGDIKYAFLEGSHISPAFAVRGSFAKTFGIDYLDLYTATIDFSLGKQFPYLNPYIGLGQVYVMSYPHSIPSSANSFRFTPPVKKLHSFREFETKGFGGIRITYPDYLNFTAQLDIAKIPFVSLKLSYGL